MGTTLSCREMLDFLSAYLDGELAAEVHADFEAHLAICSACVDYLETYRETIRLGRDAHGAGESACDEIPEELVRAIVASVRGT